MDLNEAAGMVSGTPPTISDHRAVLADHHSAEPQRGMLADLAMREIEAAIERLEALGHTFRLVRVAPEPPKEPKPAPEPAETEPAESASETTSEEKI